MGKHSKKEQNRIGQLATFSTLGIAAGGTGLIDATAVHASPTSHASSQEQQSVMNTIQQETVLSPSRATIADFDAVQNNISVTTQHDLSVSSDVIEEPNSVLSSVANHGAKNLVLTAQKVHPRSTTPTAMAHDLSHIVISKNKVPMLNASKVKHSHHHHHVNAIALAAHYTKVTPLVKTTTVVHSKHKQLSSLDSKSTRLNMHSSLRHSSATGYRRVAVQSALSQIGTPYVWGGLGPSGFDCSGLVVWSYRQAGIHLPRTTWGLMNAGTRVSSVSQLQPGDLIITNGGGHVGMYIGNNKMVHAPNFGDHVRVVSVHTMPIYSMRHI